MNTRVSLFALTALAVLAGTQTLRLAHEQAAHATTTQQWAQERAQSATQLARLGEQYRAQEGAWKERSDAATQGYFRAQQERSAAVATAARADERMHQLAASATSFANQLPSATADAAATGPACAAQLKACSRLLAAGTELSAEGAELAGRGGQLTGELGAKVELCQFAWPAEAGSSP